MKSSAARRSVPPAFLPDSAEYAKNRPGNAGILRKYLLQSPGTGGILYLFLYEDWFVMCGVGMPTLLFAKKRILKNDSDDSEAET